MIEYFNRLFHSKLFSTKVLIKFRITFDGIIKLRMLYIYKSKCLCHTRFFIIERINLEMELLKYKRKP